VGGKRKGEEEEEEKGGRRKRVKKKVVCKRTHTTRRLTLALGYYHFLHRSRRGFSLFDACVGPVFVPEKFGVSNRYHAQF